MAICVQNAWTLQFKRRKIIGLATSDTRSLASRAVIPWIFNPLHSFQAAAHVLDVVQSDRALCRELLLLRCHPRSCTNHLTGCGWPITSSVVTWALSCPTTLLSYSLTLGLVLGTAQWPQYLNSPDNSKKHWYSETPPGRHSSQCRPLTLPWSPVLR